MSTFAYTKDPQSEVTRSIRWSDWLRTGETISTSTWTVTGSESPLTLTLSSPSIGDYTDVSPVLTDTVTSVQFVGGTAGVTYTATNRVVTSMGDTDDRSITVRCWNK